MATMKYPFEDWEAVRDPDSPDPDSYRDYRDRERRDGFPKNRRENQILTQ